MARTVLGAALPSAFNALSIQGAADDVITNTREVANAATTNKHNRVLLKVVAFARNIYRYFFIIGETNPCDFAQGGVRLLRCHCLDEETDSTLLRTPIEHRRLTASVLWNSGFLHQLIDSRHLTSKNAGHCPVRQKKAR